MPPSLVNRALLGLPRRAEVQETSHLSDSFVEIGTLLTRLQSLDHQVFFGRRGSGKTHALIALQHVLTQKSHCSVFIDMRRIGSRSAASEVPDSLARRGTELLSATVEAIVTGLAKSVDERHRSRKARAAFDDAARAARESVNQLEVSATASYESTETAARSETRSKQGELNIALRPAAKLSGESDHILQSTGDTKVTSQGLPQLTIRFGAVARALEEFVAASPAHRVWILIDEWTTIPRELQPLLADLLRRCVMPVRGITVKIAAIRQRAKFRGKTEAGETLGFELNSDIAMDISLDDEYSAVLENESEAVELLLELLRRHVEAEWPREVPRAWVSTSQFGSCVFEDERAIRALCHAAEGNPRDAFNVVINAAERAGRFRISLPQVNGAAVRWFKDDKFAALEDNAALDAEYRWLVEELNQRDRRRFILGSLDGASESIAALHDCRLVHQVRRDVRCPGDSRAKCDEWAIDYGALLARRLSPARLAVIADR